MSRYACNLHPGISFKTQVLYATVFVSRYLALFTPPWPYLIIMKLFFIGSSFYVIYLMKFRYRYVTRLTQGTRRGRH